MDALLLLIITALGACGVSLQVKRRYYFYYDAKTQPEALDYCREKHTDLATITSMDDVNTLRNMVDSFRLGLVEGNQLAWFGLYDDADGWEWSLSNRSFYSLGESDFRQWSFGFPDNAGGREECVTMNFLGGWNDLSCTRTFSSICCDVSGPSVTFVRISIDMTWSEARSYCREHHTDLASVRNAEENEQVKQMIPFLQEAWIGLHRDSWKWYDGSNASFRYWSPIFSEPNNFYTKETCASVNFGDWGQWTDWPCDYKRSSICHTAGITKLVIRLSVQTTNPPPDLNHPAVMAQMLEQLEQKLKGDGLSENIRLSWRKQPGGNILQEEEREKDEDESGCEN